MQPILFKIGNFPAYSYGALVALAVFAALFYARWAAPRFGLAREKAQDLTFVIFAAGIVGARLFYVLQHFSDYEGSLWQALWIREGGLVWYGGFGSAFLAGIFYANKNKLKLSVWADFFSPAIALSHAIGRIGCFLNGCCYGRGPQTPVQLQESAALFVLSVFLFYRLRQAPSDGSVFVTYLLTYSFLRFWLEYLRGDQSVVIFFTWPQWISLGIFSFALCYKLIKK